MVLFFVALTTISILHLPSLAAATTPTKRNATQQQPVYNPFNADGRQSVITNPASINGSPLTVFIDQTQSTPPPSKNRLDQEPDTTQQTQEIFPNPLQSTDKQNEQNFIQELLDSNTEASLNRNQFAPSTFQGAPLGLPAFPSAAGYFPGNFLGPSNILTLPAVSLGNPVIPTPLLTSPAAQPRLFNQNRAVGGGFLSQNPYQQPFQRFQIGPAPLNNHFTRQSQLRHPAALAQLQTNVFPLPITYDKQGMPIRGGAPLPQQIRTYSQPSPNRFVNLSPISNSFQAPKHLQVINTPSSPASWSGGGANDAKPVREENSNENEEAADEEGNANDDAEEEDDDEEEEDSNKPETDFDPFVDGFPFENDDNSNNWFNSFGNDDKEEEEGAGDGEEQGIEEEEDDGDKGASEQKWNIFPLDQHAFGTNQKESHKQITATKQLKQQKKKKGRKSKKNGKSLKKKKKTPSPPPQPQQKIVASESQIIETIPAEQRQKMFKERWFLSKDFQEKP